MAKAMATPLKGFVEPVCSSVSRVVHVPSFRSGASQAPSQAMVRQAR